MPVGRVVLASDTGSVRAGGTLQLTASVADAAGAVLSGRAVTWRSTDEARAVVSQSGLVTGLAPGRARIIAESEGRSDTAAVTVLTRWTAVTAATGLGGHVCALAAGGKAYCWGDNEFGELGDGTTEGKRRPTPVSGGHVFTSLSAGALHTCGVTTSGEGLCWGDNSTDQLGAPTGTCYVDPSRTVNCISKTPIPVSGGLTFSSITSGYFASCGLTATGASCWGNYGFGEGGWSATPMPAPGAVTLRALDVGSYHACGLSANGSAYCWGPNSSGLLGNGDVTASGSAVPVAVAGGLRFPSISAGGGFTCGITTARAAYCWGSDHSGQLGAGPGSACNPGFPSDACSNVPVPVAGGHEFVYVSAGTYHACALTIAGAAYCWGNAGALGDGTTEERRTPVAVAGGLAFAQIAAGPNYTCGVTTGGALYCWGGNGGGRLGTVVGTSEFVILTPAEVVEP